MHGSLLQTLDEREDKAGYAIFRTQDGILSPNSCTASLLGWIKQTDNTKEKRKVGNSLQIKWSV